MKAQFNIIILLIGLGLGQLHAQITLKQEKSGNTDVELANEYYSKGEFDKARLLYEKLSKVRDNNKLIHDNYINTLIRLKDIAAAEKYLKQEIKDNPDQIVYKADLAYLKETDHQTAEADKLYDELLNEAADKDAYVFQLQNFFYKTNKMNMLIDLLLKSRVKSKQANKHNIQLARAYLYAGKKREMLEEVFSYGIENPNTDYVQRTIQDNITEEAEIEMLEQLLYKKIQENPNDTYFTELLIWHFTQIKEFGRAFTQARAIDRRKNLGGIGVYNLAELAYQSRMYRDASKMYQYLMSEYPDSDLTPIVRRLNIQCREQIVKSTYPIVKEDIEDLISQYTLLLKEVGISPKTLDAMRNMALLYAFYLNDHSKAVEQLENAVSASGSNLKFKDQCKLDLGDIFILKNEPWESTLLYMQVEKSQKEDHLAELAKLKNAKLYYFTGEFDLAKEILDVLKKATTREIANDAMQLSLLIQDNLGLDTTDAALKAYADVELLLFQNQDQTALKALDSLFVVYKSHSLADEMLWLKANIYHKLDDTENALKSLEQILQNYKYDILADDALYLQAKIYDEKIGDKKKAMDLYRSILTDFPGSIYGAEARKRFRELRGDVVF